MTAAGRLVAIYEDRLACLVYRDTPKSERFTLRVTPQTLSRIREMAAHWRMTQKQAMEDLLAATVEEAWAVFRARREGEG